MKKLVLHAGLVLVMLLLMSCAGGANGQVDTPNADGVLAGFWRGLWHGVIAPITFVISLFSDRVNLYEVHNNGGWYNLGFLVGITTVHGSGHVARRRRKVAVA